MTGHTRDWNIGLLRDLRDDEFAREFWLAAIDEGIPIEIALAKLVRASELQEFRDS